MTDNEESVSTLPFFPFLRETFNHFLGNWSVPNLNENCRLIRPQCEALGNNYRVCGVYSPDPHAEVYCFRLNFNISKLVY